MGGYPDAFDYPEGGEEARKVWNDAQVVLDELEQTTKLNLSGILGIFLRNVCAMMWCFSLMRNAQNLLAPLTALRQQTERGKTAKARLTLL